MAKKKSRGHTIEIRLSRSPISPDNNYVKLDGKRLIGVTKVTFVGKAANMPRIRIELLPLHLDAVLGQALPVLSRPVRDHRELR
jgi:hypothetical protein